MITEPKVCIVFAVYNKKNETIDFLNRLSKISYKNYEVVITDDCSTDGTSEAIQSNFPHVHLLTTEKECWGTKSFNIAAEYAITLKPKYISTVSVDMWFENDFLTKQVKFAEENPGCFIGCIVYKMASENDFSTKNVWHAGGKMLWFFGDLVHRNSLTDGKLDWISAMAALFPIEVFHTIGLYDECFIQYCCDSDFSLRAKIAGFDLKMEQTALVWNRANNFDEMSKHIITWKTFYSQLFNLRSGYHLKTRWILINRYWPKAFVIPAIIMCYARFSAKQVLRIFRRYLHAKIR